MCVRKNDQLIGQRALLELRNASEALLVGDRCAAVAPSLAPQHALQTAQVHLMQNYGYVLNDLCISRDLLSSVR